MFKCCNFGMMWLIILFCFCSIGGDENLTTITTLPSESSWLLLHGWNRMWKSQCLCCSVMCTKTFFYLYLITDILKHFSLNLTGYSVGIGKQDTSQAFLNQAVAGAKSKWVVSEYTFAWIEKEKGSHRKRKKMSESNFILCIWNLQIKLSGLKSTI